LTVSCGVVLVGSGDGVLVVGVVSTGAETAAGAGARTMNVVLAWPLLPGEASTTRW
jgi:hypothetical protein